MGSTHKLPSKLPVLSGAEVGGIPGVAVECVDIGISGGTPVAKAAYWALTDAEARKHG